jgi:uncharacterized protein (DUF849 family)
MRLMPVPLIIEAALNGGTPKARNPNVPRTPDEVAADAVRCLDAGAAIVHNHNDDPVIGGNGVHAPQPYVAAWRQIVRSRPGAILYPTMPSGGAHTTIEQRYSHIIALAEERLLGLALVDPGSVNLGGTDEDGLPRPSDSIYTNTFRDARYMFDKCNELGLGVSISVFEPSFLRVALAYHKAGKLPPAMIKFYMGAGPGIGFGLPPTEAGLNAYLSMMDGADIPWLVSAIGGDVVATGLARLAIERGGHIQLGLEPYGGPRTPANEELVREVVALAKQAGRPVASTPEAREIIGLPA